MGRFLFLVVSLLAIMAAVEPRNTLGVGAEKKPEMGGFEPIKNISDPRIQGLGQIAVKEYNNQTGSNLFFLGVVGGRLQVVEGINYIFYLIATDDISVSLYNALAFENLDKELILYDFYDVPFCRLQAQA